MGFGLSLSLTACGDDAGSDGGTTTADATSSSTDTNADSTDGTESSAEDTTTTSTTDATDTASETTNSGGFVESDMMDASCGAECDIWNPDDCPEGEKCTSVACEVGSGSWDSNVCREIGGSKVEGDECMYMMFVFDEGKWIVRIEDQGGGEPDEMRAVIQPADGFPDLEDERGRGFFLIV